MNYNYKFFTKSRKMIATLLIIVTAGIFSLSIFSIAKMGLDMSNNMPCPISKMAGNNNCFFMFSKGVNAIAEHLLVVNGYLVAIILVFSLLLLVTIFFGLNIFGSNNISSFWFIKNYWKNTTFLFSLTPTFILTWLSILRQQPQEIVNFSGVDL